jgi:pimeloyl-ACP methyl ester carboxylesterase
VSFLPTTPASTRRHAVNGIELHVTTWQGSGPPLLLIHGISGTAASWWPIVDDLSPYFTPIAPDLRGHGGSSAPASGYLYADYAADVDALLADLGIDQPLILGHSLGGLVALWWARSQPDRAAALLIEDSPLRSGHDFMPTFDRWLELNAMSADEATEAYALEYPAWSLELCRHRAEQMTATARNVFAELRAESLAHHGVDRIAEMVPITSPALLIHGDPDAGSMVHPADAAAFDARLPNATAVRIPGGSHGLHLDHREAFLNVALPFLRQYAVTTPAQLHR